MASPTSVLKGSNIVPNGSVVMSAGALLVLVFLLWKIDGNVESNKKVLESNAQTMSQIAGTQQTLTKVVEFVAQNVDETQKEVAAHRRESGH